MEMQQARQLLGKQDVTVDDLYKLMCDRPDLFTPNYVVTDIDDLKSIIDECCADPTEVKKLLHRICRSKYLSGFNAGRVHHRNSIKGL